MSDYLLQQLINSLTLGSLYALIAVGFSMIYGIVRLINFAHGDIVMIGAFVTLGLTLTQALPWPVIFIAVLGIGALVGATVELVAFRPLRDAPQVTGFITSLALSIMIQNLGILILSPQQRNFSFPAFMLQRLPLGGASIRVLDLLIIVLTLVLVLGLVFVVRRTKLGMAMRATAENPAVARLMGIRVNRVILAAFAIGSALAAIAGLMWGGRYGQIDPLMGIVPGLKAFVAAVIGGVGSLAGAMLGGYLLGFAEVLVIGFLPPEYASFRDAFVFGLLILVLLVMPNGLMGRSTAERA